MVRALDRKVSTKGLSHDPRLAAESAAFKGLWRDLNQRALRKEVPLELTPADVRRLYSQSCSYCGAPPLNQTKYRLKSVMTYNGIDRIDNARGYTLDNCVSACTLCNAFKSGLSLEVFLAHVERIHEFQSRLR